MTNYFYTDTNGNKQGPVDEQQLKELAAQGSIIPTTPMETDTGHKGVAGQIPGLFPAVSSPFAQPVPSTVPPPPVNLFCTNCGQPVFAQAVACMSCGARPTGHKKFCRHCGVALNPEQIICTKCGAALTAVSSHSSTDTISDSPQAKNLNTYFMVYWICMAAGLPLCFLFIGIPIVIAGAVFFWMLLYQLWKLIPADIARTTPGKAVGFCFIPFFNFYWIFVAFKGLGEDMNKTLQSRGIQYQVNEDLGLATTILWICNMIPYVNILTCIPGVLVLIFFLKSVKDGAIALLEQEG